MTPMLSSENEPLRRFIQDAPRSDVPPERRTKRASRVVALHHLAKELAAREGLKFEGPAEFLLHIVMVGTDPLEDRINERLGEKSPYAAAKNTWVNHESGEILRVAGYVDLDVRIDCARILMSYMHNKLSSVELTATDEAVSGQVEQARLLAADPDVRALFEKIAEKTPELIAPSE